uniref:Ig-like domain-containing protein n=1 Tax=Podarcis muralis TaxID=64176 RepID=A0A670JZ34_PODMU
TSLPVGGCPCEGCFLGFQLPHFPKPVLSLETMKEITTGQRVTMLCGTQGEVKRFYLQKDNFHDWSIHSDMNMFTISDVSNKDAGRYSCSYTSVRQPYLLSEPSNPVKLLLTGKENTAQPNISLIPGYIAQLGSKVTIQCSAQGQSKRFYLHKTGKQMPLQVIEINGTMGTFFMKDANLEDGGNYSCRYSAKEKPFIISEPSDLVTIKITDPDLPRPSISFHPSPMPQLGENITIQCSVNNSYKAWYLYKDDGKKELQSVEASSSDAVFLIKNVSEADGGSYYCNYRPQSGSFISEASNIVDLYLVEWMLSQDWICSNLHISFVQANHDKWCLEMALLMASSVGSLYGGHRLHPHHLGGSGGDSEEWLEVPSEVAMANWSALLGLLLWWCEVLVAAAPQGCPPTAYRAEVVAASRAVTSPLCQPKQQEEGSGLQQPSSGPHSRL